MHIIEKIERSSRGHKTEDLIVETPDFFAVFDGMTGTKMDWEEDGKTMGQWAAFLAGETLKSLDADATLQDFIDQTQEPIRNLRSKYNLSPHDRLACTALVLPRRTPYEIWSIGDSHLGYTTDDGNWHPIAQGKPYDDVTYGFRQIHILQEIMDKGAPQTQEEYAHIAWSGRKTLFAILEKQMLFTNHIDPEELYGFGMITGKPVPAHHQIIHHLPNNAKEIVLCSDGLPLPPQTFREGEKLLRAIRDEDPFMIGRNRIQAMSSKGFVQYDGTIADYYDDVAYLRVAV